MKKIVAFILVFMLCVQSTVFLFAKDDNWQDAYVQLLHAYTSGAKGNATEYEGFALYDIDNDGIPELFLKDMQNEEDYQIYRYERGNLTLEKKFKALNFYIKVENGDLVIKTGNEETGVSYIVYEKEFDLEETDYILFKSERYKERPGANYKMRYYNLYDEISEEQYYAEINQLLQLKQLNFKEINETNVNEIINADQAFYAKQSNVNLKIEGDWNNSKIIFDDGVSTNYKVNGVAELYGILCVNGTFISGVYPVLDQNTGATLIPVRVVGENLDSKIDWNPSASKVEITKNNTLIEMVIGEDSAFVNSVKTHMIAPAQIIEDTTYVPVRFVSENLDAEVNFYEESRDLPTIISVEEKYYSGMNEIDEMDAIIKVMELFEDVSWLERQTVFTKSYMNNIMNIRSEGIVAGRFWSVVLDQNGAVKIWIDKYTSQAYTVYSNEQGLVISAGYSHAIDALVSEYI